MVVKSYPAVPCQPSVNGTEWARISRELHVWVSRHKEDMTSWIDRQPPGSWDSCQGGIKTTGKSATAQHMSLESTALRRGPLTRRGLKCSTDFKQQSHISRDSEETEKAGWVAETKVAEKAGWVIENVMCYFILWTWLMWPRKLWSLSSIECSYPACHHPVSFFLAEGFRPPVGGVSDPSDPRKAKWRRVLQSKPHYEVKDCLNAAAQ